ncbi:hypothetical protein [Paenarthrobacter ureafaciens]|uniref:hypothetical protein n=1 Tax=Paenarthrobacter ureafaciens TaxID=37931 RepID=UPI0014077006|nr:hypothetical protein [Paenarthrobacter ureafaciens]MCX8455141.1 hypothetical protein [Paenarthrobacter ureafaciens]MCY0974555.1 hypothetical protein [Paenarthrobacter ureafaciens]
MKVTLTVQASNGDLSHVEGEGHTYEAAKTAAEARIPEGSTAIVIRTARDED